MATAIRPTNIDGVVLHLSDDEANFVCSVLGRNILGSGDLREISRGIFHSLEDVDAECNRVGNGSIHLRYRPEEVVPVAVPVQASPQEDSGGWRSFTPSTSAEWTASSE